MRGLKHLSVRMYHTLMSAIMTGLPGDEQGDESEPEY